MMRRLLDRNIATLVLVVLAGQLLAAVLLYQLVMRPQTARLAEVTAEMTDTVGRSMAQMSAPERRAGGAFQPG
jgi:two-component system osmolarity sensor histidine kinase EnvZ